MAICGVVESSVSIVKYKVHMDRRLQQYLVRRNKSAWSHVKGDGGRRVTPDVIKEVVTCVDCC